MLEGGHGSHRAYLTRELRSFDTSLAASLSLPHEAATDTMWSQYSLRMPLPYFVFIMYMLNTTKNITNAMFINCDHCMLNYAFFHEPKNLLKLFQIRLREMIKMVFQQQLLQSNTIQTEQQTSL